MGRTKELNQVTVIQDAIKAYEGFTSSEKKYCNENVVEWVSEDETLNVLISKFEDISLDARPFLQQNGLLA